MTNFFSSKQIVILLIIENVLCVKYQMSRGYTLTICNVRHNRNQKQKKFFFQIWFQEQNDVHPTSARSSRIVEGTPIFNRNQIGSEIEPNTSQKFTLIHLNSKSLQSQKATQCSDWFSFLILPLRCVSLYHSSVLLHFAKYNIVLSRNCQYIKF